MTELVRGSTTLHVLAWTEINLDGENDVIDSSQLQEVMMRRCLASVATSYHGATAWTQQTLQVTNFTRRLFCAKPLE